MVKHNEAIRGHKMLRAFIHPRQYSFLASAGCTALGARPRADGTWGSGGKGAPSIFEAKPGYGYSVITGLVPPNLLTVRLF